MAKKKTVKKVGKKAPKKETPKFVYRDPLHIPSAKLVVTHKGKEVLMMNKALLDRQNCWENLEAIKAMHVNKLDLYDLINATNDPEALKLAAKSLTAIEFELQKLWKFPLDSNFHRIWEYPKCECPQMDNIDRYPHGHIINSNCPLHSAPLPELTLGQKIRNSLAKILREAKEKIENGL